MQEEEWKPIEGYEGLYEISSLGRVRSLDRICKQVGITKKYCETYVKRGKIMSLKPKHTYAKGAKTKYYRITVVLYDEDGGHHQYKVHRLVAEAFIPNPDNKPFVNHKDCNPCNNSVDNLEWCTPKENVEYMDKLDRRSSKTVRVKATSIKTGDEQIFESIEQAKDATGCSKAHICGCCRGYSGRKTSGGFYWSYA